MDGFAGLGQDSNDAALQRNHAGGARGRFEVVGGCPPASIQVVRNPELASLAEAVGGTLRKIVEAL
jgi:hypothetical protein